MKIDRPYENWTRFPNCILDHLNQFTGNELKVLALMVRKNLGWSNPNRKFSGAYIALKTGMNRETAGIALAGLIEKGSIVELPPGPRNVRRFEVNWEAPAGKSDRSETATCRKIRQVPDGESDKNLPENPAQYKKPVQETRAPLFG